MNAIGLENVGVEKFLSLKLPYLQELGVPVIVTFSETRWMNTPGFPPASTRAGDSGYRDKRQLPECEEGRHGLRDRPRMTQTVVRAVRAETSLPLITKLTPNVTSISEIAKAAEGAGSDIISCINTLAAMAVDVFSRRPRLANVFGGLSGPAVKPVALRCVYEVTRAVKCPVIGIGGITNATDALEFLLVGAEAVQVGTANFINPAVSVEIIEGIARFL